MEDCLPALTPDNVAKVCIGADVLWTEELCTFMAIPWCEMWRIRQLSLPQERLRAAVEYWLSIDHAPSWRRVIAVVDYWSGFYTEALTMHDFAGPISDPSLVVSDIASVLEKVQGKKYPLGDFYQLLRFPETRVTANKRVAATWWVGYSHSPSWAKLISLLITCQENRALKVAKRFLPTTAPDPSLTVDALCEILCGISDRWENLCINIGVPFDQIENIKKQCEDNISRCGTTAWQYWLINHPAPSWTLIADGLYENMEHDALRLLKKKYPIVINHAKVLFDCQQAIQTRAKGKEIIFNAVVIGFSGAGKSSFVDKLLQRPHDARQRPHDARPGFARKAVRVEVPKSSHPSSVKHEWKCLKTPQEITKAVAEKISFNILHHPDPQRKQKIVKESLRHLRYGEMPTKEQLVYYDSSPSQITTPFQAITSSYGVKEYFLSTGLRVRQCTPPFKTAEKMWTHYITEVGGLPHFQMLFPNLIPCPSLFYYVFRANQDLSAKLQGEYRGSSEVSSFTCETSLSYKEAILQFLASVASMKVSPKPQGGGLFAPPKVLFIATHLDQLESKDQIFRVDQELQEIVKKTRAYKDGLIMHGSKSCMLLAVDNMAGNDDDDDDEDDDDSDDDDDEDADARFQKVRSVIEQVVTGSDDYCIDVPYTWSLFSATIQHQPDPVLCLSKCLEVGKECGINEKDEMLECLSFFHHIGVLCYFQDIIPEVVFIDPQYLYDKITQLVVNTAKPKLNNEQNKTAGVFTPEALQKLLSCSDIPSFSQLTELLQQSCILASFSNIGNSYFLPCSIVCATDTNNTDSPQSHLQLPPLHFTFECEYSPKGFVGAFIASLSFTPDNDFKAVEFDQDRVCLSIGPHLDKCLLSFKTTFIRVDVFLSDISDRGEFSEAKVCWNLRQQILHSLEFVTKRLHLDPVKAAHRAAFYCPCHADSHLAIVEVDSSISYYLNCSRSSEPTRIALPNDHLVWFDQDYCMPEVHDTKPEELIQPTLSNLFLIKWTDVDGNPHRLRIFDKVSSKWWQLGTLTEQSNEKLENYRLIELNDNFKCCHRVFSYWIENNESEYSLTWDGLYELLKDVDCSEVEHLLREALQSIEN